MLMNVNHQKKFFEGIELDDSCVNFILSNGVKVNVARFNVLYGGYTFELGD